MAIDVFKPRGKLKRNTAGAGVASVIDVPIICTVMSSVDPTHQGRVAVYPSENLNKDAYNNENWIWVGRLAGFAGQTAPIGPDGADGTGEYGSYTQNPSSYGQWNAPPDKLTKVICLFVNGDPNYGFYIGTIPNPETLSMIPAIGASENVTLNETEATSYGGAARLPTTNLNTNNPNISDSVNYLTDAKPVHSYTASIMQQQGILRDKYRGPISTSATREASSRVGWGVSTPGRPVYQGGATDENIPSKLGDKPEDFKVVTRRGGHSMVMDDGDIIGRDQLIRLRTALGHQILMSDDGQMLSILHSNGQSYIELGKEGTVDVFSTNSINLRTQGDLNLHADETLNLSAKNVNINASENTTMNTDKVFKQRVGEDYNLFALKDIKIKTDAAMALDATGQVGVKSAAEIFNEGSKIHLNDGAASLTAEVVEPIEIIMHPDTIFDDVKGWAAALAKIPSVTSRAPAHMPWMNANQGADVQVDPSAEGSLPAPPSDTISDLNSELSGDLGGPTSLTNPSGASAVSEVGAISDSLDKNATTNMLSGIAASTQSTFGIGGGSVNSSSADTALTNLTGGAISAGTTAVIGKFGATPSQLAAGGVLKPGADTMVNTLISAKAGGLSDVTTGGKALTSTLSSIMPSSSFSGKGGVNSLQQFIGSPAAQAGSTVSNLQKGQKSLQTLGVITGKESSGGMGAIVQGTATALSDKGNLGKNVAGVKDVVNNFASAGSALDTSGDAGSILGSMKAGASAMLASNLSGATGGITSALDTLNVSGLNLPGVGADLNIGASASSFKSIVNSFPTLPANVPVDLVATAGAAAAKVAGLSAGMSSADLADPASISAGLKSAVGAGAVGDAFSGALTSGTGAVSDLIEGAAPNAVGAINNAVDGVSALGESTQRLTNSGGLQAAASQVQTGATSRISGAVASGISQLPGGQKLAGSVIDNAKGAVNPIADGLGSVTDGLGDLAAKAFDGLDAGDIAFEGQSALGDIKNSFNSLTDQLTGAIQSPLSAALSPGAAAALKSALSSLTAGGGSTIKLPVVAFNTYDRSTITGLVDKVLGDPIVPRPNLLGEIPAAALSAFGALSALKKTLSKDVAKLSSLSKDIAKKKSTLFAAQSNFPAGSPEIAAAQSAYDSAVTDPAYKDLVDKIQQAEQLFDGVVLNETVAQTTNPFSDIETLLEASSSTTSQGGIGFNNSSTNNGVQDPNNPVQGNFDEVNEAILQGIDPDVADTSGYDTSYSNILATIAKTYVPTSKSQYQIEPYTTDYMPEPNGVPYEPNNSVESVVGDDASDALPPEVDSYSETGIYTDYGLYSYLGGASSWKWDTISMTWKHK